MGRAALVLVVAALSAGCLVDVDFGGTRFSCERDGTCPGGYDCVEGACVLEGPGGSDGGAAGDDGGGGGADAANGGDASIQTVQCGVVELEIALGETTTGTTVGGGTELGANCTESDGAEVVHRLLIEADLAPVTLTATSDLAGTGYDAVLYVRTACDQADTELGCNDEGNNGDTVTFTAQDPGIYYIVVDSHAGGSGNYELVVNAVE